MEYMAHQLDKKLITVACHEETSSTNLYVDVHSGYTPSENSYLSKCKKEKYLSMLLLS